MPPVAQQGHAVRTSGTCGLVAGVRSPWHGATAPAPPVERGFFALDGEVELGSAGLTPQAEEGLVWLSTWQPYGRAAGLLAALTGVQVSRTTARRLTEASGAAYEAVQTEEAEQIRRTLPAAPLLNS